MKPAAHTRMGAVGLGSRLLGPTPARAPLAAPPAQASPRRAPRRGSWPSASRPAARRPAGAPGAARVLAAVRSGSRRASRRAGWLPSFPWRRERSRGPTGVGGFLPGVGDRPGSRGALGWSAGCLVGGVGFGLEVGCKAKQESRREIKNPDPDSLVSGGARRARGVPNLLYSSP